MSSVLNIQRNSPSMQMSVYRKMRSDPTQTQTLRNAFVAAMRKRFRALRGLIRLAVVEQDVLALSGKNNLMVQAAGLPGNRAFDFSTSQMKVQGFMTWLRNQMDNGILEVGTLRQAGSSIDQAWTDLYVRDSYQRGVQRARYELRKAGFPTPSLDETGGISTSMSTPFHMDRVGVMYSRVFEELKGITAAMDSQISRVLSQGLIDGDNPRVLARKLNGVIKGGGLGITDSIGRFIPAERRAEILARTEVIRAHHQGMIQEYKNWGLEGVRVKAEWSTAMDDRVCSICAGMEGNVYTLEEVSNMIPAHPQCRCIALPTSPDKSNSKL